jgi:hypothetical protein
MHGGAFAGGGGDGVSVRPIHHGPVDIAGGQGNAKFAGSAAQCSRGGGVADVAWLFGAELVAVAGEGVVVEWPEDEVAVGAHLHPGTDPLAQRAAVAGTLASVPAGYTRRPAAAVRAASCGHPRSTSPS